MDLTKENWFEENDSKLAILLEKKKVDEKRVNEFGSKVKEKEFEVNDQEIERPKLLKKQLSVDPGSPSQASGPSKLLSYAFRRHRRFCSGIPKKCSLTQNHLQGKESGLNKGLDNQRKTRYHVFY